MIRVLVTPLVMLTLLPPISSSTIKEDNYAIIVDAGSSGSRVFLYRWSSRETLDNGIPWIRHVRDPQTAKAVVMKRKPGLSTLASTPGSAVPYMLPLIKHALKFVPQRAHSTTKLFILATAGLRLLPKSESDGLMAALRVGLPAHVPFPVVPSQIAVIQGVWEGIYSWIAINYVMHNFTDAQTHGMVDVGGGSVQIAFEVPPHSTRTPVKGNQIFTIKLGCGSARPHKVYVTTYLGYGANSALDRYADLVTKGIYNETLLPDPCLPLGQHMAEFTELTPDGDGVPRDVERVGTGKFDECRRRMAPLLDLDGNCRTKCSIKGNYQPPIPSGMKFYGFAELWYSTHDVLDIGGPYNVDAFKDASSKFCLTDWTKTWSAFKAGGYPRADEHRLRNQCAKSVWMSLLLHEAFHLDANDVVTVSKIKGAEVQWTMGALLYSLSLQSCPLANTTLNTKADTVVFPGTEVDGGGTSWSWIFLLLLTVLVVVLGIKWLRRWLRLQPPALRRNRSFWSYMVMSPSSSVVDLRKL